MMLYEGFQIVVWSVRETMIGPDVLKTDLMPVHNEKLYRIGVRFDRGFGKEIVRHGNDLLAKRFVAWHGSKVLEGNLLVEPLVVGIEGRDGHIENLQVTHGSVATAWLDEDSSFRLERVAFAIELDVTFALQDEIDLRHLLVVVRARVFLDGDHVHGRQGIVWRGKGAFRLAAGAADGRNVRELRDHVVRHAKMKARDARRLKLGSSARRGREHL